MTSSLRYFCCLSLVLVFVVSVGLGSVRAESIAQITDPFVPVDFFGVDSTTSQFDGSPPAGLRPDFATIYDNFVLSTDPLITSVSWVGQYQVASPEADFTVSFYESVQLVAGVDEPGNLLGSFNVGNANPVGVPGEPNFTANSAAIPDFQVPLNETLWVSVVANLSTNSNVWGWAHSNSGDGESFQDRQLNLGDVSLTRFREGIDYSFNLTTTAVPEPGAGLLMLGVVVAGRLRRTRTA